MHLYTNLQTHCRPVLEAYTQLVACSVTRRHKFFDEGYLRFNNILEKFLLLGKIEANSMEDIESLNLRSAIDGVLALASQSTIDEKKITVKNDVNGIIFVKQNKAPL